MFAAPWREFCTDDAPPSLRETLKDGGLQPLIAWAKDATTPELEQALHTIHMHRMTHRSVIETELLGRRQKRIEERLEKVGSHLEEIKQPNWIARWTLLFTAAALVYSYCSWQHPLTLPQVSQAELQRTAPAPQPASSIQSQPVSTDPQLVATGTNAIQATPSPPTKGTPTNAIH